MQNSELHRKAMSSGMIEGMVNSFERIMLFICFLVKLPLSEAYSLLFLAKRLHNRLALTTVCLRKFILTKRH